MPSALLLTTEEASRDLLRRLRRLLELGFDGDFDDDDWAHTLGGWHALVVEADEPVAHAAVVPRMLELDGRRLQTGYVEGVATAPHRRGRGLGSLVMTRLVPVLHARFEVGALGTGEHGFYARLGWERWLGPTFVRTGSGLTRTPDDDDAIMVLRFGPSRHVPLDAAIVADARSGDAW